MINTLNERRALPLRENVLVICAINLFNEIMWEAELKQALKLNWTWSSFEGIVEYLYIQVDSMCLVTKPLTMNANMINLKKIGAFHLERRESKPKAWVRLNKDIEMNPNADDSHPSTNEA